jgi:LacI family transcriptional regulator
VVDYLDEELNEVTRAIQLCREIKPLGILFLGGNSRNFSADFPKIDIPCVEVTNDASALNFPNLSSVTTDDREAARRAIDTLVARGHRKIAVIGGDKTSSDISRLRLEGCQQSFWDHGISFDPQRDYRSVRFSCEDGYNATRSLLRSGDFTAIFAFSDLMAIGALRALWEAGKRVPEDVSVMGLDGLSLGKYLVPQLSTVRQDFQTIAQRSVEILLDAVEDGMPARHETVPFQVQPRESIRSVK